MLNVLVFTLETHKQPYRVVSMINPIFQMKKLKVQKWKSHAHHHRVSERAGRWTEASCLQNSILVNTLLPCCSQDRYEPSLESAFLDNYRHHKAPLTHFLFVWIKYLGGKETLWASTDRRLPIRTWSQVSGSKEMLQWTSREKSQKHRKNTQCEALFKQSIALLQGGL